MKRTLLAFVLLSSPAFAADGFITAEIYQADFDNARECRPIDAGRRLWEGEQAFYVQTWAGPNTDELDEETRLPCHVKRSR